jgi:serine protease Do
VQKEIAIQLVPEKSVFNAGMIRARLGLNLEELTPQVAARYGVGAGDGLLVTGVEEDSQAATAGLQRNMLVAGIDGRQPGDICAAAKLLYPKKKGDRVQLDLAVPQRMGNLNVLRQGSVELPAR